MGQVQIVHLKMIFWWVTCYGDSKEGWQCSKCLHESPPSSKLPGTNAVQRVLVQGVLITSQAEAVQPSKNHVSMVLVDCSQSQQRNSYQAHTIVDLKSQSSSTCLTLYTALVILATNYLTIKGRKELICKEFSNSWYRFHRVWPGKGTAGRWGIEYSV